MTTGPTGELAAFAAALRYEDLPPEVVAHVKLCLLDTLGCGLFGSTLPWVEIVRDTVGAIEDGGSARLWGRGATASPPLAALVNGTAVHAFELDDLHRQSIVHPGSVVVSAAQAVAALRPGAGGRELVTAMVAGYEVAARVGMSMGGAHLVQGWHPTGTHGALGAAAAAGSMLGLDAEQMRHAIGTAGSHSSGLMASQFSSMVKRLHAGHAAQSGVLSALLARNGFLGIPDLLENPYGGYLSTFSPVSHPELILAGLGTEWEVAKVGFKPYSTNGSCHPAIDALRAMQAAEGIGLADVESVAIRCSTATYKHVGWEYVPDSVTTAQMNLSYIVSVVLADGDAFVDQFTAERIADPELVAFSRRITVTPDAAIDAGGDAMRHATQIDVTLRDGRVLTDARTHAHGSAASPLTREDLIGKFTKLARKAVPAERVERIVAFVDGIDETADLAELEEVLAA